MKSFDFALISDCIFYALAGGAVSFCILRYYRVPVWLSLVCTLLLAAAIFLSVYLLLGKRRRKFHLTKKQTMEKNALMLHLALERVERVQLSLLQALQADGKNAILEDGILSSDGIPAVVAYTMQPLDADAVARLLQKYGEGEFLLFCNQLSSEAEKLLSDFGRKCINAQETYELFSRTETTPSPLICGKIPKKTAKRKLRVALSKRNARAIFTSGLLLLLMSLFTYFPVYYLSVGCLLVFSSVAVKLFGVTSP